MRLPEPDEAYLDEKGFTWDLTPESQIGLLILRGVTVADGRYDRAATDVLIHIPSGYPNAGLDMFWVDPPLKLAGGGYPNRADHFGSHGGRQWQRFSRHLASPWKPGIDNLASFLALALGEIQGTR